MPRDFPISPPLRYARHANATIDIQDDFNTTLKQIKHKDGFVSEMFPTSLRDLFSYDGMQCSPSLVR